MYGANPFGFAYVAEGYYGKTASNIVGIGTLGGGGAFVATNHRIVTATATVIGGGTFNAVASSVQFNRVTFRARPASRSNILRLARALGVGELVGTVGFTAFGVRSSSGGTGTFSGGGTFGVATTWRHALANVTTTSADIVIIGDSVSEGQGASLYANRYVSKTLALLRANHPVGAAGGNGYIPPVQLENTFTAPWTLAGGASPGFGLAERGVELTGVGQTATITQTCSSFQIDYVQGGGNTGGFTVTVDGGTPTTVTVSTSGPYSVGTYSSGALTAGSHTVQIGWLNTNGAFGSWICGGYFFNGDETKGVRTADGDRYGTFTTFWSTVYGAGAQPGSGFINANWIVLPAAPKLVIINLGLNDYSAGVSPATVQTNLTTIISAINTVHTNNGWRKPSILLIYPYLRTDVASPAFSWASYLPNYQAIVAADRMNIQLLRLDDGTITQAAGTLGGDQVHPTDTGHARIATLVDAALES